MGGEFVGVIFNITCELKDNSSIYRKFIDFLETFGLDKINSVGFERKTNIIRDFEFSGDLKNINEITEYLRNRYGGKLKYELLKFCGTPDYPALIIDEKYGSCEEIISSLTGESVSAIEQMIKKAPEAKRWGRGFNKYISTDGLTFELDYSDFEKQFDSFRLYKGIYKEIDGPQVKRHFSLNELYKIISKLGLDQWKLLKANTGDIRDFTLLNSVFSFENNELLVENPSIVYRTSASGHNHNVKEHKHILNKLANTGFPIIYAGVEVDNLSAAWFEYYQDPYLFCIEPMVSELKLLFTQPKKFEEIHKLTKIKKVLGKGELIGFIKKYSWGHLETNTGIGIFRENVFDDPRYFRHGEKSIELIKDKLKTKEAKFSKDIRDILSDAKKNREREIKELEEPGQMDLTPLVNAFRHLEGKSPVKKREMTTVKFILPEIDNTLVSYTTDLDHKGRFVFPKYFIRKELRKRGVELPEGLAENYAKELGLE